MTRGPSTFTRRLTWSGDGGRRPDRGGEPPVPLTTASGSRLVAMIRRTSAPVAAHCVRSVSRSAISSSVRSPVAYSATR